MRINKGEVYIVNQPKHTLLSVIVVNSYIYDVIHDNLYNLSKVSDIIFLFSDFYNEDQKRINKEKFTSLYQACGFIDCPGSDVDTYLFKIFSYSKEIFNKHIGYLITETSLLSGMELDDEFNNKLLEINGSSIIKPIFKIRRATNSELKEIYYDTENESEKKYNNPISSFIGALSEIIKECDPEKVRNDEIKKNKDFGKYCCYSSDSEILYFRNGTINLFCTYYENDNIKNYVKTFSFKYDVRCLLSSMVKKLGIENLNLDIKDLNVNKLRPTNNIEPSKLKIKK